VNDLRRKSDFVADSIFPLSALRNKLSFERRERAPFKHAQVPRKILHMHPSALNGVRNKKMAQVQHDTEIKRPRHLPGIRWRRIQPHKAKFGPLPAKSFSETDFDTRSFRYTRREIAHAVFHSMEQHSTSFHSVSSREKLQAADHATRTRQLCLAR
jgi:hypothetical protein